MYKVLIVEDDPMVAMINEQYIKRNKNFEIVGKCNDGLSALYFLENNKVDLLILDVFMPKMDGFETLRQIRNKQIILDAIMVTAANERESLEETLHLGIVDYLKANTNHWFTGDEIVEKVNFTGVTVRRYMNYLAESGRVVGEMNYETGGRPCMKYCVK